MNFGVRLTTMLALAAIGLIRDPAMTTKVSIKNHSKGSVRKSMHC